MGRENLIPVSSVQSPMEFLNPNRFGLVGEKYPYFTLSSQLDSCIFFFLMLLKFLKIGV